ncbi:hypothetical protein GGU10DRAFT_333567 [Lentinula aff. detonsa]|uniref:C3H1-type domain-containing protein n=1 Tax=Lentinula aff. detonsa TaxID=2804958 RepID=A0AA38NPH0_9AGAR|nr:hypothetical protein GGU10DRAFT_333567 [Lentinula aff. detonsa]
MSPPGATDLSSPPLAPGLTPEMEQSILSLIQRALTQQQQQTQPTLAQPTALADLSPFVGPLSGNTAAVPLSTYFSILLTHAEAAGKVSLIASDFFKYNAHLIKITSEYEWSAVVGYHMAFFNKRRREMQNGDYSGWGKVDMELQGEHLYNAPRLSLPFTQSSKSSKKTTPSTSNKSEPCRKFDQGLCPTTPCPFGRPHMCKKCKLAIADSSHKCT